MEENLWSNVVRSTLWGSCGWDHPVCRLISDHVLLWLLILLVECLIFVLLLIFGPPGKARRPDARSRVLIAVVASLSFYFWILVLSVDAGLCVGFVAHQGVCVHGLKLDDLQEGNESHSHKLSNQLAVDQNYTDIEDIVVLDDDDHLDPVDHGGLVDSEVSKETNSSRVAVASPLVWQLSRASCSMDLSSPVSEDSVLDAQLVDLTLLHVFIVFTVLTIFVANLREALGSRALVHESESLLEKSEVQKFISKLVTKPPDVGHFVTCFHSLEATKSMVASSSGSSADVNFEDPVACGKVVTFRNLEHFGFQHWRDFSELRLISPSSRFPVVETEVTLNFFPGDQPTAEKYKAFVVQLTEKHRNRDSQIAIDDYFHLEDGRQWSFLIGDRALANPWWDRGLAKVILSVLLLIGWPLRMRFQGQVATHRVEIKKAVFCLASASQDEGVSLSTPTNANANNENTVNVNSNNTNVNNSNGNIEVANVNNVTSGYGEAAVVEPSSRQSLSSSSPPKSSKLVMETEARLELASEEERRPLMASKRSREMTTTTTTTSNNMTTTETKNTVEINSSLQRGPRELIQHINTFSGYETYV